MTENDRNDLMIKMGLRARAAQKELAILSPQEKSRALLYAAEEIENARSYILEANAKDVSLAQEKGCNNAFIDRLALNAERLDAIIKSIEIIEGVPDPVGEVIDHWTRPNGLEISRVRTPLGVIGIIYESRPNVTIDAAALCLKSGNAAILRPGSESFHSSHALHRAFVQGIVRANISQDVIQMVPSTERSFVGSLLSGLNGTIDVLIPRGGKSLVQRVQEEARIPVFAHLEGVCHVYVDKTAQISMAKDIVLNAKMRRTAVCSSAETLLIDRAVLADYGPVLLEALDAVGCAIKAVPEIHALFPKSLIAREEDFYTEYLDAIISVNVVDGVDGAIQHIQKYSSHHTETIVAEDDLAVQKFFRHLDSAILLHNASTQFADGGEFGFGAEIGIATGKMHARGPIGVQQLTSFQYHIHGTGQIRP